MESDSGVKSVWRASRLLKRLASQPGGWRLSDLARDTGFGKTTTHRLLAALLDEGLVYQDAKSRSYHLGYELVRLGRAAGRYDMAELARPSLLRIARETGDTVFVSVREGLDAICLDRREGAFPIKTLTLNVGDRRPLGVGAGSLALLSFLPDAEVEEVVDANHAALDAYRRFGAEEMRRLVARTRADGYAYNEGRIVSAMCAVGVPVRDPDGRPVAALSVAAIAERMEAERMAWIVDLLQEEAGRLARRMRGEATPVTDADGAAASPNSQRKETV